MIYYYYGSTILIIFYFLTGVVTLSVLFFLRVMRSDFLHFFYFGYILWYGIRDKLNM